MSTQIDYTAPCERCGRDAPWTAQLVAVSRRGYEGPPGTNQQLTFTETHAAGACGCAELVVSA